MLRHMAHVTLLTAAGRPPSVLPAPADTLCLLANFVLKVWAVREAVCELAYGYAAERLAAVPFYTATYLLVAGAYFISVLVPSIYVRRAAAGCGAAYCCCCRRRCVWGGWGKVPLRGRAAAVAPGLPQPFRQAAHFVSSASSAATRCPAATSTPSPTPSPTPVAATQGLLALVGATATVVFSYFFPRWVIRLSNQLVALVGCLASPGGHASAWFWRSFC